MLGHDVRHAIRVFRANPTFTLAALLVLSIGIGASTATFSVVHAVLIRPLPFDQPDRIVRIWSAQRERNLPFFSVSAPDAADWQARTRTLGRMALYARQEPGILNGDDPEQVLTVRAGRELFELLGVPPLRGRWFSAGEDAPGSGARVAVISGGLWQRRFGGRADVIGETLRLDDRAWTVVGVMPTSFGIPNNPADVWLPLQLRVDPTQRSRRYLRVLARLRDGTTIEDAAGDLERVAEALGRQHPASNRGWMVTVRPLADTVVGGTFRRALLLVAGGAGLVLLIACANLAGLLLARNVSRAREVAVRSALGASRGALVRQMLAESLVLAAASAALGVLLAMWTVEALTRLAPTIPRGDEIVLRPAAIVFACAITAITVALFGLVPALRASRPRLEALHVRQITSDRATTRARDILVLAEVALAMVLLVGAGLMLDSVIRLQRRDLGFDPRRLLLLEIGAYASSAPPASEDALRSRLAALPGVVSVGAGSSLPFAGPNSANVFTVEGRVHDAGTAPDTDFRAVSPEYFRTLGIPLLRGRTFTGTQTSASPEAIISASVARRFLADRDPIGRRVRLGDGPWMTIVGVAGDVRYRELDEPGDDLRPMMYLPLSQSPQPPPTIVVRSAVAPDALAAGIRRAVREVVPLQPIARLTTMEDVLTSVQGPYQFNASIVGAFAWIALVLAAAGVWGLVAHGVACRTHEIGIRVALGARPVEVLFMAAWHGVALAATGIGVGVAAALALSRLLQRVLFEVSATDPRTIALIAAAFIVVSGAASILPACRALRVDPLQAVRSE